MFPSPLQGQGLHSYDAASVQKEFRYVLHVDLVELGGLDAGEGDKEHA